jgi:tRNA threonylcarbamoyladenosine biosynthesis protein TsaB
MMNILAIDTSMQACSVAVLANGDKRQISCVYEEIERGHAERLLLMVDETLVKSGLDIKHIGQFAVSRGPGTFTGVRIGIAAARGLALACKKPLIGVGTLQILAARVLFEQPNLAAQPQNGKVRHLGIAVDARRGEIYWQSFDLTGKPLSEPLALTPQTVASLIEKSGHSYVLAGSGVQLIAPLLTKAAIPFTTAHNSLQPDAARLAEIIAELPHSDSSPRQSASPLYLRPADAKIQTGFAIERQ